MKLINKIKLFLSRLGKESWIPKEYYELKEKLGNNFEIDGYTYSGDNIRDIRIKLYDNYHNEKITDSFEVIGKIEMENRIKNVLTKIKNKVESDIDLSPTK